MSDETPVGEAGSADGAPGPEFELKGRTLKEASPGLSCELCGGPVLDRHCKVVCLNCGFQRDCSDP
jgi:hypothetical protein